MKCAVCEKIREKKNILFEDDNVFVMLSDEPWSVGHVLVLPKKHVAIVEQVPDDIMGALFDAANKAGMCAFEGLSAKGTNILVQNGLPAGQKVNHVIVHVIPRFDNDGVDISWSPKQAKEADLDAIEKKLLEEEKPPVKEEAVVEVRRSVRRIP